MNKLPRLKHLGDYGPARANFDHRPLLLFYFLSHQSVSTSCLCNQTQSACLAVHAFKPSSTVVGKVQNQTAHRGKIFRLVSEILAVEPWVKFEDSKYRRSSTPKLTFSEFVCS